MKNSSNNNLIHRYIVLPHNLTGGIIENSFNKLRIKTITNSSKRIKNVIDNKNDNIHVKSDAGVYSIQCLDGNKKLR